jgi:hypothetical protein
MKSKRSSRHKSEKDPELPKKRSISKMTPPESLEDQKINSSQKEAKITEELTN